MEKPLYEWIRMYGEEGWQLCKSIRNKGLRKSDGEAQIIVKLEELGYKFSQSNPLALSAPLQVTMLALSPGMIYI